MTNFKKVSRMAANASYDQKLSLFNFMLGYFGDRFTDSFVAQAKLFLDPKGNFKGAE